jgi:hypothetical protein
MYLARALDIRALSKRHDCCAELPASAYLGFPTDERSRADSGR